MTFPVTRKTMKKNVWQLLDSYLCMQEDLEKDNGHSLVLVLRKSGSLSKKTVRKESGTIFRKRCCWNSQKADVQFSVQQLHCPGVSSKAKDTEKLSIHFAADELTIETIFRNIISVNQLSIYEAVAATCEEYESLHDRSGQPDVLMGQPIVLSEINEGRSAFGE